MSLLIGIGLAAVVAAFARIVGFDREKAFYPVVLVVVASYYVLFAVLAGDGSELVTELALFALFAILAVLGFRRSLWFVVGGLAAHGVFDLLRHAVLASRGVPVWWPDFCLGFDVAAAAWLALMITMNRKP